MSLVGARSMQVRTLQGWECPWVRFVGGCIAKLYGGLRRQEEQQIQALEQWKSVKWEGSLARLNLLKQIEKHAELSQNSFKKKIKSLRL